MCGGRRIGDHQQIASCFLTLLLTPSSHKQRCSQQVQSAGGQSAPGACLQLEKSGPEEKQLSSRAFSHLFIRFFIYPVSTLQTCAVQLLCSKLQLEHGDMVVDRDHSSLSSWRCWHCTMKPSRFGGQEGIHSM